MPKSGRKNGVGCSSDVPNARQGRDAPRTRYGKIRLRTLADLDHRTNAAHVTEKLVVSLTSSLGGRDHVSAGQAQLVQRAAVLGAVAEDYEVRWINGEEIAIAEYLMAVNAQRRVLATIGLERHPRDLTPDLATYLRQRQQTIDADLQEGAE